MKKGLVIAVDIDPHTTSYLQEYKHVLGFFSSKKIHQTDKYISMNRKYSVNWDTSEADQNFSLKPLHLECDGQTYSHTTDLI